MRKIFFINALILFLAVNIHAGSHKNEVKFIDYTGEIGGKKIFINLSFIHAERERSTLTENPGPVEGSYCFISETNAYDEKRIYLKGRYDGKKMILKEYNKEGKKTGGFELKYKANTTLGSWEGVRKSSWFSKPEKCELDIMGSSGVYEEGADRNRNKRYEVQQLDKSEKGVEEIEEYAKKIKNAVINHDTVALSKLPLYPLTIKVNGRIRTIKSPEEFIRKYDIIADEEFVSTIKQTGTVNLPVRGYCPGFGYTLGVLHIYSWKNEKKENVLTFIIYTDKKI